MSRSIATAFVLAIGLAACSGATAAPTEAPSPIPPTAVLATVAPPTEVPPTEQPMPAIQLTDGLGRAVELMQPASRIVTIVPSNTEILFAIGAGDQVVGRDDFSDYPEEALEVTSIGSTFGELNVEAIVGLEPDLVLVGAITPPEQIESLEAVGLTVYAVSNPADFEGLFEIIGNVAELTGRQSEAEALVAEMRQRYDSVIETVVGAEPVSVFYELDGSDPTAPWTTGTTTFQQMMFDLIAAENIAADIQGWGQLSLEEIVVRDPEVIIFGAGPFVPTTVESLSERSGWTGLSAVANGQVYGVDTDLLDLPGPRLVEGLETMARILHPELFDE